MLIMNMMIHMFISGFPTLGLFSISRHPNYVAEQVISMNIIIKIEEEGIFDGCISAAVGGLLSLLSGRDWSLLQPLHHWLHPPRPTFPGEKHGHISTKVLMFPLLQGSTLLSEGISSGRHPAYLDYKKTVPR